MAAVAATASGRAGGRIAETARVAPPVPTGAPLPAGNRHLGGNAMIVVGLLVLLAVGGMSIAGITTHNGRTRSSPFRLDVPGY